ESSAWIAETLSAGLADSGIETESAGVITTPGIAYLTHTLKSSAGIVISASHNPWQDNGIKIFGPDGYKLADEVELEIEEEIFSQLLASASEPKTANPSLPGNPTLRNSYIEWLARSVSGISHFKVVVDCANGAASAIAPEVFQRCGAQADFTHS